MSVKPLLPPDLSLRELRLIVEVADRRSFTEASRAVHLSQSALSRLVGDAEKKLGAKIFSRTTRSVELTGVGVELIGIARRIVDAHALAMRDIALLRDGLGGRVRISAIPTAAVTFFPALAACIADEMPDMTIEFDDCAAHAALEKLRSRSIDIAIVTADAIDPDFQFTALVQDSFRVIYPSGHRFARQKTVTWPELARERLVMPTADSGLRTIIDAVMSEQHLSADVAVESRNINVIGSLVAAGFGVAAVPDLVITLMAGVGVGVADLVDPPIVRTVGAAHLPSASLSPAARRTVALLGEIAASST